MIHSNFLSMITALACLATFDALVAQNRPKELDKAETKYKEARNKAEELLEQAFDTAKTQINKLKNVELPDRLKMLDIIKAEKERFQQSRKIPWSIMMRPALTQYLRTIKTAELELERVYAPLVEKAIKQSRNKEAEKLREDYSRLVDKERCVAVWRHRGGQNIQFLANGHIDQVDSKATWSLEGNILTMRWQTPGAPGGAWIDMCEISQDGSIYKGKNQKGHKITGEYVP